MSLPVTRPTGRALVVASPTGRQQPVQAMCALGFGCAESDDPYAAIAELARRPLVYRAIVLSLAGVYREELELIRTIKRRYPHIDVWLTQTDGRQSALAEAMRLGADGLLADDGLHRIAIAGSAVESQPRSTGSAAGEGNSAPADAPGDSPASSNDMDFSTNMGEPVLTADELRALLQEQPAFPPEGTGV